MEKRIQVEKWEKKKRRREKKKQESSVRRQKIRLLKGGSRRSVWCVAGEMMICMGKNEGGGHSKRTLGGEGGGEN